MICQVEYTQSSIILQITRRFFLRSLADTISQMNHEHELQNEHEHEMQFNSDPENKV